MSIQCQAINLSAPYKQCRRLDTAKFTMPKTGLVYDAICTKHIEQINQGKELTFTVPGKLLPTQAVIETADSTTHIDLKSGVETIQAQLPLEKEGNMDASESRVMRIIDEGKAGVYRAEDEFFVVAGTGSRSLQTVSREKKMEALQIVEAEIKRLKAKYGDRLVIMSGMAEGFDKLLALTALKYEVNLWCAIPNQGYADYYWGRNSLTGQNMVDEFKSITANAWCVTNVCGKQVYVNGQHSNFIRNDFMVAKADAFLVWDPSTRGTAQCFKSIKAANKPFKVLKG